LIIGWSLGLILSNCTANGQTYKFRHFRTDDGIPQPFTYCIEQDDQGYLWVGTGKGLVRFDGFGFSVFNENIGLKEAIVTTSFKDTKGRIWFGNDHGNIILLEHNELQPVEIKKQLTTSIIGFAEDANGSIWVASQNSGVVSIDIQLRTEHFSDISKGILVQDILIVEDKLFLGHNNGSTVNTIIDGEPVNARNIPDLDEISVNCISADKNGTIWFGTGSNGVFKYFIDTDKIDFLQPYKNNLPPNIQEIIFDQNGDIWIATFGDGVIKYSLTENDELKEFVHYNKTNGAEHNHIKDVFQDREGNIWIAKFGDGIATLINKSVVFYMDDHKEGENILSLEINNGHQLIGTNNGLLMIDRNASLKDQDLKFDTRVPKDDITAIHTTNDGTVWIGTKNSGLYRRINGSFKNFHLENDRLSKTVTFITSKDEQLWVATRNGVYGILDGSINNHLNTMTGLGHNAVNHILIDTKDRVWISTNNNGLSVLDGDEILRVNINEEGDLFNIMSTIQDANEDMWIATYGNGVYHMSNGSIERFTPNEGLHSSFCYSLLADKKGKVWIGHHGGISTIDVETKVVTIFDKNQGITSDMNPNAVLIDENENIWFGTNNGLVRYDPEKDKPNTVPPVVNITAVKIFDEEMDLSRSIDLSPDLYKIRFEFLGVSMKNSDEVTYQYKLEGYDLEWSDLTRSNFAIYNRVGAGELVFKLKACNSDGICTEQATVIPLLIRTPIWQRWWFIVSAMIVAVLIIRQIVHIRERNQLKVQEFLKNKLDERTVEVRAKSAEIEQKNKDITDSLNYAKHIQEAILPEDKKLKELFPGSFIFHQPRDIVSGDFYWFKRYEQKFLLACADATGHGVPGAFMSMIGSILLRDLSNMRNVDSPEKLLDKLDLEIRSLLKQRTDGVTSNDGMDITICEIDLESRKLRTASAMHSIFINRNGKLERVKGDRHSIGGTKLNGSPLHFSMQEYALEPGDKIYLFSDGFQDQFGGMDGKKLKIKGAVDLIKSIMDRPMDEQSDLLRNKFRSWMNGFEQVDDVLFIALQV